MKSNNTYIGLEAMASGVIARTYRQSGRTCLEVVRIITIIPAGGRKAFLKMKRWEKRAMLDGGLRAHRTNQMRMRWLRGS